ncbi:hypothetical protein ACFOX0_06425 [Micromonospora zhanjiangensis]|uniref:Uncharacterized protein n=1 Tax=Micromonospora zhanjiangensis TaxID=1522057 RepID=A0ABV8KI37_9ACTN
MKIANYKYQSDFARRYFQQGFTEGKAEGEAKGQAMALLTVLAARDRTVSDAARQRITECTDPDQFETWIRRAATAISVAEILA